jgi:hypothetical protein
VTPLSKVITLASLLAVGAAGVANAQSDPLAQQVQICSRNDDIAAPGRIAACTTVIQAGRLTPPNRALALVHRGDAYAAGKFLPQTAI